MTLCAGHPSRKRQSPRIPLVSAPERARCEWWPSHVREPHEASER